MLLKYYIITIRIVQLLIYTYEFNVDVRTFFLLAVYYIATAIEDMEKVGRFLCTVDLEYIC